MLMWDYLMQSIMWRLVWRIVPVEKAITGRLKDTGVSIVDICDPADGFFSYALFRR